MTTTTPCEGERLEEEITMAEDGQVDAGSSEGESMSNGGAQVPQKRRGRPKNPNTKPKAVEDPQTPRRGRGRPKGPGSEKRAHSQEGPLDSGSPNKRTPRKAAAGQEVSDTPKRGRGRPSKPKPEGGKEVNGGSSTPKKRGRPKGSPKSPLTPNKGRGRPKVTKKRGRPRKHPLPSAEELKKPKVWKPLGRPRKYPRVDPPEGATETLQRGRGRPLKVEKRGAHLKKTTTDAGPPKKRGRPKKGIVADETEPETSEQVEGHLEEVELETVSHEEVEDTEEDN